ncbi:hypothetical protein MCRY_21920 [Marivita cryptomonadis]|nr:hypothetical protein MCRY_21920 [Marivita cryptomonadis]
MIVLLDGRCTTCACDETVRSGAVFPASAARRASPGSRTNKLRERVGRRVAFLIRVGIVLGRMGLFRRLIMLQGRVFLGASRRLVLSRLHSFHLIRDIGRLIGLGFHWLVLSWTVRERETREIGDTR